VLLILGISALVCPLPVRKSTILSEIPFALAAAILVGYLANAALFEPDSSQLMITRGDGAILLFFFVLFMAYIFKLSKNNDELLVEEKPESVDTPFGKSILYVVIGILALFFGGNWVVDGAVLFAKTMGMSETFIGLTIIAIGTSLPELVTSVRAAMRKNTDIAVGNVVGSNIFNILWIIGISSLIRPLPFAVISNNDILVVIGSSTLLLLFMSTGKKSIIDRWEGGVFLSCYVAYTVYLIMRG
jgi:cation:H+ antiporter